MDPKSKSSAWHPSTEATGAQQPGNTRETPACGMAHLCLLHKGHTEGHGDTAGLRHVKPADGYPLWSFKLNRELYVPHGNSLARQHDILDIY